MLRLSFTTLLFSSLLRRSFSSTSPPSLMASSSLLSSSSNISTTLNGWHPGERVVHKTLGFDTDYSVSMLWRFIDNDLPPDHAHFHSTRLPFIPVTTLDAAGRPWGTLLAHRDGRTKAFVSNPKYSTLHVEGTAWPGEPLVENLKAMEGGEGKNMLVAGIGIEFETGRRNKFAGRIVRAESRPLTDNDNKGGVDYTLEIFVNEALGNCPKYINIRQLEPQPSVHPRIAHQRLDMTPDERLPPDVVQLILQADTVFVGTTYEAPPNEAARFPSHVGMNQRGGLPGFVRVMPSDGKTVVLPDYSGNRFLTSLGNIEATPLASLTFLSFTSGDVLYLTGTAQNLYTRAAQRVMPFQERLTTVTTTGYVLVRDALPVRQRAGTQVQRSPYSPPVRLLAEELERSPGGAVVFGSESKAEGDPVRPKAALRKVQMHAPTIATFTFELVAPPASPDAETHIETFMQAKPGQAAILDFKPLLGRPEYQHMAPRRPSSVNDDRVRTWTIARLDRADKPTFSLTMREKPGGIVTGALFSLARRLAQVRPELLADCAALELVVDLVGLSGAFVLPEVLKPSVDVDAEKRDVLWIAGGIGVTPFLAMLRALPASPSSRPWNVHLVLSTREPDVFVPLLADALARLRRSWTKDACGGLELRLDVFSHEPIPDLPSPNGHADHDNDNNNDDNGHIRIEMRRHIGRLPADLFKADATAADARRREVYLCGPEPFERFVLDALAKVDGVDVGSVHREGFRY